LYVVHFGAELRTTTASETDTLAQTRNARRVFLLDIFDVRGENVGLDRRIYCSVISDICVEL
jgi:hypothetical protein